MYSYEYICVYNCVSGGVCATRHRSVIQVDEGNHGNLHLLFDARGARVVHSFIPPISNVVLIEVRLKKKIQKDELSTLT